MPGSDSAAAVLTAALDDLLAASPEWATAIGEHRFDDRLSDLTDDGLRQLRGRLAGHRDAIDSLDLDALSAQDRVDAELMVGAIDARLFDVGVLAEHERNPLLWLPGEALHPLLESATLPAADRLRSLAARMEQIPEMLALAQRTVSDPAAVHLETAIDQTRGALSLVLAGVSGLLALEPSLTAIVAPAQEIAAAALEQHLAVLREQVLDAHGDPRLGHAHYAARLHLTLDSALTPELIVERATAHLAHVEQRLHELTGGDVAGAFERIAATAPTDATVVALAGEALQRITAATRELDLVTVYDDPVEVKVMPEFRRGVAIAYCDPPGPLDPPGLPTVVAISPTPGAWDQERRSSFYREYNTAMLTDLMVHEAMPGHALQLQHSARFVGSSAVRKVLWSGTFVEGWAVHAEGLLAEHLGGDVVLMMLKMQLRMAINALLDAGVHAGGMTEAEAMDLMTRRGRQQEGEAVGKWRRAQLTSTQLSTYFVGWLELEELFGSLDLSGPKAYDRVLAHGSPSPRHLRTLVGS
jgi:uncharacterized protein (DUF885 family)